MLFHYLTMASALICAPAASLTLSPKQSTPSHSASAHALPHDIFAIRGASTAAEVGTMSTQLQCDNGETLSDLVDGEHTIFNAEEVVQDENDGTAYGYQFEVLVKDLCMSSYTDHVGVSNKKGDGFLDTEQIDCDGKPVRKVDVSAGINTGTVFHSHRGKETDGSSAIGHDGLKGLGGACLLTKGTNGNPNTGLKGMSASTIKPSWGPKIRPNNLFDLLYAGTVISGSWFAGLLATLFLAVLLASLLGKKHLTLSSISGHNEATMKLPDKRFALNHFRMVFEGMLVTFLLLFGSASSPTRKCSVITVTVGLLGIPSAFARNQVHDDGVVVVPPTSNLDFDSNEDLPNSGKGISACIKNLYGDNINVEAITAWIKFYQVRWNLTHVDIYIRDKEYKEVQPRLEAAIKEENITVHATFLAFQLESIDPSSLDEHEQRAMTQCLLDAKERGNDYLINFDSDEYLVSEQYDTIQEMFAFANNKPSIRFPTWVNNYHFCSSNKPTMGSATWREPLPVDSVFDKKNTSKVYTDLTTRSPSEGQRKFIMRTDSFNEIGFAHHPTYRTERFKDNDDLWMFDFTGRKSEMQDVQIIHLRADVGIQADQDSNLCRWSAPEGCRHVFYNGTCTENMYDADLVYHSTEMHRILDDAPLTAPALKLYEEAVCYAERYKNLKETFCEGHLEKCNYYALADHFAEAGQNENLIFGCHKRHTQPALPVLPKPSETQVQDVHLFIFETDETADVLIAKQGTKAGLSFTVIGRGHPFKGFGTKWNILPDHLVGMDPKTLVLVVDGRDTMLNIPQTDNENQAISTAQYLIDSVKKAYEALTHFTPKGVVMSAEASCCVAALTYVKPGDYFDSKDLHRTSRACSSGAENCLWAGDTFKLPWEEFQNSLGRKRMGADVPDVYLNSGMVAGTAQNLLGLLTLADIDESEDDQAIFTDLMYHRPDLIVLDYAQEIFGNNRWWLGMDNGGCVYEKNSYGIMIHQETKSNPLMIHTAGKFWTCFSWIASQLELDHITRSISRQLVDIPMNYESSETNSSRFLQATEEGEAGSDPDSSSTMLGSDSAIVQEGRVSTIKASSNPGASSETSGFAQKDLLPWKKGIRRRLGEPTYQWECDISYKEWAVNSDRTIDCSNCGDRFICGDSGGSCPISKYGNLSGACNEGCFVRGCAYKEQGGSFNLIYQCACEGMPSNDTNDRGCNANGYSLEKRSGGENGGRYFYTCENKSGVLPNSKAVSLTRFMSWLNKE